LFCKKNGALLFKYKLTIAQKLVIN